MEDLLIPSDDQELAAEHWQVRPPRVLSNRDRDIFLALLDADPEPTEAAKKAAAEYNKGWHEGDVYHFQLPARRMIADSDLDEQNESNPCAF